MRKPVFVVAGVAAVLGTLLVLAAPSLGAPSFSTAAPKPRLSFASDGKGWYIVTVVPASRLKATLIGAYGCDLNGTNCQGADVIDSKVLPKAAKHRVSWGLARFWGQPAADAEGSLYPGNYKIVLSIPGTRVSKSTSYKLSGGG